MKKLLWRLVWSISSTAFVSVIPLQADDFKQDQGQIESAQHPSIKAPLPSKSGPCDGLRVEEVKKILKLPFKLSENGLTDQGVSGYVEELIELSNEYCIESINRQMAALRSVLLDKIKSFRIQGQAEIRENSEFNEWYARLSDAMNATWKFEDDTAIAVNTSKPFNTTLSHFYTELDAFINHNQENNTPAINRLKITSKLIIKGIERTIITQQFMAYLDERRIHKPGLRSVYEE